MTISNYGKIIPLALVAVMGLSAYNGINTKAKTNEKYEAIVQKARDYAKDGIYSEAEKAYLEAQKIKDSADLRAELGKVYIDGEQLTMARSWADQFVSEYPHDAESYEYGVEVSLKRKDFDTFFTLYDKANSLRVTSDYLKKTYKKHEYEMKEGYVAYADASVYSQELSPTKYEDKWGYVNESGKEIGKLCYVYAGPFSTDGMAPVIDNEGEAFFVNKEGNKEKAIHGLKKIDEIGMISEGIFPAKINDKWAYYDLEGKKKFGSYDEATTLANGYAAVYEDGMWNVIDAKGKKITQTDYNEVVSDEKGIIYRNDRIFVDDAGQYYMIDSKGKKVGKESYQNARTFGETDGYAAVEVDNKWGYIDKSGKMVIKPKYENARSFVNGFAAVEIDGKWGFIDKDGNTAIKPSYEGVKDFSSKGSVFVQDKYKNWKLMSLYKDNHEK